MTPEQATKFLSVLPALRKPHYTWWSPVDTDPALLAEWSRLTGSSTVTLTFGPHTAQWAAALTALNDTRKAGHACRLAVFYSPWGGRVTPYEFANPLPGDGVLERELKFLRDTLREFMAGLPADVCKPTPVVVIDSEGWTWGQTPERQAELLARHRAIAEVFLDLWSGCQIEWYARGSVQASASETGWTESDPMWGVPGSSSSVCLYRAWEPDQYRREFGWTAGRNLFPDVTPWVALGCGYARKTVEFHVWRRDVRYDPVYSWMIGAEINQRWFGDRPQRYAPWNRAKSVVFYPSPLATPTSRLHAVAYARGAALERDIADLVE